MNHFKLPLILFISTLIFIGFSRLFIFQIDFTEDKRYTLSEETMNQIQKIKNPLKIDVFLSGNMPSKYLKFRNELDFILNRIKFYNKNISLNYINPLEFEKTDDTVNEMIQFGLPPEIVRENKNGNIKQSLIFPWLVINYGEKSEKILLLQKQLGDNENEKIFRSLEQLEYKILDGLHKVILKEKKNIAILTSHETTNNIKIADLLQNLKPYYNLGSFDLKNKDVTPKKTLENLKKFDLLVISNPKNSFSQKEKYIIDQFSLSGGKLLWMINGVTINRDSLFNNYGRAYSVGKELNLDDYFFNLGIRIQKKLVKDLYCAPIVLANGQENDTQYIPYPWPYNPLSEPENFVIGKDLGPVLFQFASPIDTLENQLTKTLLIKSSNFTKTSTTPSIIELTEAINEIKPNEFKNISKDFGYLIEGRQKSLFTNRIKPFNLKNEINYGLVKLIIFSDGNIAENQIDKGFPLSLGYDKWTNNYYSNKDLIINSIHYLVNNNERLLLRDKNLKVNTLDKIKIKKYGSFWKWFMLIIPLLIGLISGFVIQFLRFRIKS